MADAVATAAPPLQLRGLVSGYLPGINVIDGVDLELADREIVAVIGPNGAGKSTLVKAAFGLAPVRGGEVLLGGTDVTGERASQLVAQGMGYVPQRDNVFPTLSVRENLALGAVTRPGITQERMRVMYELFPRLAERERQAAGTLSGGERQMVAFARALMPQPSVLLLDEPSAGLAPRIVGEVFRLVRRVRDEAGVAVLLVEQNARRALQLADRGIVLDQGQIAHEGPGAGLLDDPDVVGTYLGGIG